MVAFSPFLPAFGVRAKVDGFFGEPPGVTVGPDGDGKKKTPENGGGCPGMHQLLQALVRRREWFAAGIHGRSEVVRDVAPLLAIHVVAVTALSVQRLQFHRRWIDDRVRRRFRARRSEGDAALQVFGAAGGAAVAERVRAPARPYQYKASSDRAGLAAWK
jgi:hypothetical protein